MQFRGLHSLFSSPTSHYERKCINLHTDYHILKDFSSSREVPWQEKKLRTLSVSKSYERLDNISKAQKVFDCGHFLEFKHFQDNTLKLNNANFCRVRLCPMCAWRRSLKIFGQCSKIMNIAAQDTNRRFLFLTLTIKNIPGVELCDAINTLLKGYDTLFKNRKISRVVKGSFRSLEITHNTNKYSKSFDTYHPHLHCILLVENAYFNKGQDKYISQNEWSVLWKNCIKADYMPIVHIEKVQNKHGNIQDISSALCEVSKYSVKDSDYVGDDKAIQVLDIALANRRLVSFRGEFSKIQKDLKLDDMIDGDLVNTDIETDPLRDDLNFVIERYRWHIGYNNYIQLDSHNEYM